MTKRRTFLKNAALTSLGLTLVPSWSRAGIRGYSPNAQLQIGVIGTGKQANGLASRIAQMDTAVVVAGCDVYAAKLEHFVAEQNKLQASSDTGGAADIKRYRNYQELLEHPGLDAVIVATPDHQHASICLAALARGLHVYCEKPLAHTIEEGRAVAEAVRRSGKVLQTGSMQRSQFTFQHAVALIRAGKIGQVKEVLVSVGPPPRSFDLPAEPLPAGLDWPQWIGSSVQRPFNGLLAPTLEQNIWPKWRDFAEFGGGMVTDWGAHMFDIVQWALDKDRTGPARFFPPSGINPQQGLTFFYEDGTRVEHRTFGRGNAVRFIGTEGSLDVSRGFVDSTVKGLIRRADWKDKDVIHPNIAHLADFFRGIQEGSAVICPAETGHRTASICTLANIAYRLQRPLHWDPATERLLDDPAANRLLGDAYRTSLA
ncbi:Gfo/Idh/MocA family oxidoreductase [Neolewinella lacunae]|uniref:Gfo/Idh/MocA family oxidoreductase n=1 Tax=Neolewinella lacunae TaxID=1517758 RepID=A0A923PQY8_9BACT|nr:Gfo/Idh/MocA family oxidoreductase [Neolewinella lacunae]MBC6995137.1 Gfo/Idh/MocA family oxidoreductase [Neolewinella lacunae]MDN3634087.1 Gfo/Idh/MocA family oxidoreductase [Neolewinella lacunae]